MPIDDLASSASSFGRNAYKTSVENGLAVIRERDEIFLRHQVHVLEVAGGGARSAPSGPGG